MISKRKKSCSAPSLNIWENFLESLIEKLENPSLSGYLIVADLRDMAVLLTFAKMLLQESQTRNKVSLKLKSRGRKTGRRGK